MVVYDEIYPDAGQTIGCPDVLDAVISEGVGTSTALRDVAVDLWLDGGSVQSWEANDYCLLSGSIFWSWAQWTVVILRVKFRRRTGAAGKQERSPHRSPNDLKDLEPKCYGRVHDHSTVGEWLIYRTGLFVEGHMAVYNAAQRKSRRSKLTGRHTQDAHLIYAVMAGEDPQEPSMN